jgi:hypothetical protein
VFRAETHDEMLAWYHDIEQLVQLPHMSLSQRQTFIASHAPEDVLDRQRQSGSSSPGLDEDEADEVPYSQINSIEEATPQSPLRPPPGGSFPSETKLDDVAMYGRHSPVGSDVTSELQPARISRDEDVAAVFGAHDLERPMTGGTGVSQGSIGDDKDFSTGAAAAIGVGAGVGAAALAGGAVAARKHRGDEEDTDQELEHGDMSNTVAGPHEAAGYYAGTTKEYSDPKDAGISNWIGSQQTDKGTGGAVGEAALGGFLGGMGGAAVVSAYQKDTDDKKDVEQLDPTNSTGTGIETKPPVDKDVVPAALNGTPTTASTLGTPPTNTIRRSKSKKEIVEETIAQSPGNHPERGVTPGTWPETPAQELDQDGMFR